LPSVSTVNEITAGMPAARADSTMHTASVVHRDRGDQIGLGAGEPVVEGQRRLDAAATS
jgi:hypothetical protein